MKCRKRKQTGDDNGMIPGDGRLVRANKEQGDEDMDNDVGLSNTDAQEQTFTAYVPSFANHPSLKPHPDELVETASLHSIQGPKAGCALRLPSRTILDGLLTDAQVEMCLRAITQHEIRLPNGRRCGFYMGDGAGVGKGRQQAAIIFHNFLHGRRKALWLSVSTDLIEDARRDIREIGGGEFVKCHDLKAHCSGRSLTLPSGVLFCTYSLLVKRSKGRSRIDQIVEWCGPDFDGVIALDECHRAKNLQGADPTKAARAVRDLQEGLPLARVVYVSATALTEPAHLASLSRLGLWGPGEIAFRLRGVEGGEQLKQNERAVIDWPGI